MDEHPVETRTGRFVPRAVTVVLVLWLAALAHLAAHHADRPFVSVAQLQMADVVLAAEVIERQADIAVLKPLTVWKGKLSDAAVRLVTIGLPSDALAKGKRYVLALTRAGRRYQVTRYPVSFAPRVYPDNETVRAELRWALRAGLLNGELRPVPPSVQPPTGAAKARTPAAARATTRHH